MENYGVTVQKFKMAGNADEVRVYITHMYIDYNLIELNIGSLVNVLRIC